MALQLGLQNECAAAFSVRRGLMPILLLSAIVFQHGRADAKGLGRFLGSLVARGVVREAVVAGRSQPQSYAPKSYTPDVLTVAQLASCIRIADKLDGDSGQLESYRADLQKFKSQLDLSNATIELQRNRVDQYSQKSVDAFNGLIARHNALVIDGKAKQDSFNTIVEAHNLEVNAYNVTCVKRYYADDLPEAQKLAAE